MATPNIGEILTTTLQRSSEDWADSMTENNVLFYELKRRGLIEKADGGADIREPLKYAENGTVMWYDGGEQLDISPQDVLDAAKFDWKQMSAAVTITGKEERINAGSKTRILGLLDARIDVAKKSMMNQLDEAAYGNGTAFGGKVIGGLQLLISTAPSSGTVGGINRLNHSFWRNEALAYSGVRSSATIKANCNTMMTRLVRGSDKVKLILANDTDYNNMLEATQAIQQISKSDLADVGFDAIKYRGADFVLAGGNGGHIPSGNIYFLNTEYLKLVVHRDAYMTPLKPRDPLQQDATVRLMIFMGNLTISNCKLQGVVYS